MAAAEPGVPKAGGPPILSVQRLGGWALETLSGRCGWSLRLVCAVAWRWLQLVEDGTGVRWVSLKRGRRLL